MGRYFNVGNERFQIELKGQIYVDKTGLIQYTNEVLATSQRFMCISRPRRFGKSITAAMLCAYYSRGCDSEEIFQNLIIAKYPGFKTHLNKYDVILLNMQEFLSRTKSMEEMLERIRKLVMREMKKRISGCRLL